MNNRSPATALSPENLAQKRVLVLGAGDSGLAMAQWAKRCGAVVTVADSRQNPPNAESFATANINIRAAAWQENGQVSPTTLQDNPWLQGYDVVAISPGLSPQSSIGQTLTALHINPVGEMAFFMAAMASRHPNAQVIGITGSNGKTTTTMLLGEMLAALGQRVAVAGNIRPSALARLMLAEQTDTVPDYWVLELSSFQLYRWDRGHMAVGAWLNFSDNHQDWHQSMMEYAQCKQTLLKFSDAWVINHEDEVVRTQAKLAATEHTPLTCDGFSTHLSMNTSPLAMNRQWQERAGVLGYQQAEAWTPLIPRASSPLLGAHNGENILAALAMLAALIPPEKWSLPSLTQALHNFRGLPHRMALIQTHQGVAWINDSKSTTVASTRAALLGLTAPVILLLGGKGKGQDFLPLREAVAQKAKHVIVYGEDAPLILAALQGLPCSQAPDMQQAILRAQHLAVAGDYVVLSPACASFDQFRDFVDRGEQFTRAVETFATCAPQPQGH